MPLRLGELGLLAQEGGGGLLGNTGLFLPIMLILLVFYFLMVRPQRQEQARRQSMLQAIKKNDRVVTIGGIYGVVTNVQRESDEVTIKVDEANNTKLRMTLSAIAKVSADDASDQGAN